MSLSWLGALLLATAPLSAQSGTHSLARELGEESRTWSVRVTGHVLAPNGAPLAGAVVVTSAGGQGVTAADGAFAFDVHAAREAQSLRITAVASLAGGQASTSGLADVLPTGHCEAGPLQLANSSGCDPSWLPTFGGNPGVTGFVHAFAVYDDGSGPALYVGGSFEEAGGVPAATIAKWNGATWSPVGDGFNSAVRALVVYDDGSGAVLVAAGAFTFSGNKLVNRIAKWDGTSWSALGSGLNSTAFSLATFDDGSGPALVAGGAFTAAGGVSASRIARWNGSSWSALGSGVNGWVRSLSAFDDGSGPALAAGGNFTLAGGVAASFIARWDGAGWAPLGSGMNSSVTALCVFDNGSGPALHAGGSFSIAGGVAAKLVARWDGASWAGLGAEPGPNSLWVSCLAVVDDGTGPALFAGGTYLGGGPFAEIGGVARWNGASWIKLPGEFGFHQGHPGNTSVLALGSFDAGSGVRVHAGGLFTGAGPTAAANLARWEGGAWRSLGEGFNGPVHALQVFDDGRGPALYAGGFFTTAPGVPARNIARWNGSSWEPLGSGVDSSVIDMKVFDDGSGAALYACGDFTQAGGMSASCIAKWNGSSWSALGSGVSAGQFTAANALQVFDDGNGPALYVGGDFSVAGGVPASLIAKWSGSSWSALGSGLLGFGFPPPAVQSMSVFDSGDGPALHVGGLFTLAGGQPVNNFAAWNGSSWQSVGGGLQGGAITQVIAQLVHDDGSGPVLYVGGDFELAGATSVRNIARWDGSSWSALGSGVGTLFELVSALSAHDDGGGTQLYAGGLFSVAGGVAARNIARWDGRTWSPVAGGVGSDSGINELASFDDGQGAALFAGGGFITAFDSNDSFLAKWGCLGIELVPGCHSNAAALVALQGAAPIGQSLELALQDAAHAPARALLFLGLDGSDASGCGVLIPGVGEVLLFLGPPAPFLLAQAPTIGSSAQFELAIPADPQLAGKKLAFQALNVSAAALELSSALLVTLAP